MNWKDNGEPFVGLLPVEIWLSLLVISHHDYLRALARVGFGCFFGALLATQYLGYVGIPTT